MDRRHRLDLLYCGLGHQMAYNGLHGLCRWRIAAADAKSWDESALRVGYGWQTGDCRFATPPENDLKGESHAG